MLKGRNLVIDTFSEVYQQLLPWRTHEFWDFSDHEPLPNSVYVIGRKQFIEQRDRILPLIGDPHYTVFFDNTAEGSWTLTSQLKMLKLDDIARSGQLLIIGGAEMGPEYRCLPVDHFLTCIFDYEQNLAATARTADIFHKIHKPFGFLFLNGRSRPHRKYLYERLKSTSMLDQALWTMLDGRPSLSRYFRLEKDDVNLMATESEIRWLPSNYEYKDYRDIKIDVEPRQRRFVKMDLFDNTWGEIYLQPEAYIDTYFSLVTETVCAESSYSFRTEKIAKVLAMGHPWLCAANAGFYRDLRHLGFQTFDGIIDESFDMIDDPQRRMDHILSLISEILEAPVDFLRASESICKYNQQHLRELGSRLRTEFPQRFFNFLAQHG